MLLAKSLALAAPGTGPHATLQVPYDVIKIPTEVWIPLPFGYPGRRPGSIRSAQSGMFEFAAISEIKPVWLPPQPDVGKDH